MKKTLIIWIVYSLISSLINIIFHIFPNPNSLIYSFNNLVQIASIQTIFDIYLMTLSQQLGIWYEVISMSVLSLTLYLSIKF